MEILYLYIDNYKILKEANINFGGEYFFQFSKNENLLTVKKNELHIEFFYNKPSENSSIKNLSYLVGNNGAGKSTVLQFIIDNFSSGKIFWDKLIVIYKKAEKLKCISTIEFNYDKLLFADVDIQILSKKKTDPIFDFGYDKRGIENLDIIFFSNVFDGKEGFNVKGLHNVSTNFLVHNDYRFLLEQGLIDKATDKILIHQSQEVFRQFDFLNSDIFNQFDLFEIPKELFLRIEFNKDSINSYTFPDVEENKLFSHFKTDLLDKISGLKSVLDNSLKAFVSYIFLNLIKEILSSSKVLAHFKIKLKRNVIPYLDENSSYDDLIDLHFTLLNKQLESIFDNVPKLKNDIENHKNLIKLIYQERQSLINFNPQFSEPLILVSINSNETMKIFFKLYNKSVGINPYLLFGFDGFSSGQISILNLFSRFYSIIIKDEKFNNLSDEILILMDEPDLYLHPTWQKKINKLLVEFFPIIFKNKSIQIVITSNSPLPLTDVLTNNVVFFKKSKDNNSINRAEILDDSNSNIMTFGQNIHSLFKHSFFLDGGLMGELANDKLTELANYLEGKETNNVYWNENGLKLINAIGEPLIRNSFRQLYFKKFDDEIDKEIERLTSLKGKK